MEKVKINRNDYQIRGKSHAFKFVELQIYGKSHASKLRIWRRDFFREFDIPTLTNFLKSGLP